ncbi:MAG TPA: ATP-binding protein [Acidobacteriota bacterium]|nr:ATP-binding protein [Acidobacteriota bacterium]
MLSLEPTFQENWAGMVSWLEIQAQESTSELAAIWQDVKELLTRQILEAVVPEFPEAIGSDLNTYRDFRQHTATTLSEAVVTAVDRKRLFKRIIKLIEIFDRNVDEALKQLPETPVISEKQISDMFETGVNSTLARLWLKLRLRQRKLNWQVVVTEEWQTLNQERLKREGQLLLELALLFRKLQTPWDLVRTSLDEQVKGKRGTPVDSGAKLELQKQIVLRRIHHFETALTRHKLFSERLRSKLEARLSSRLAVRSLSPQSKKSPPGPEFLKLWVEQLRAVEAEARLEIELTCQESNLIVLFSQYLDQIGRERAALRTELQMMTQEVRQQVESQVPVTLPAIETDIVPAPSRVHDLESAFRKQLRPLQVPVELVAWLSPYPPKKPKPKLLRPSDFYLRTFDRRVRSGVEQLFADLEAQHTAMVTQVEQAREVIVFGTEALDAHLENDRAVAREAFHNALRMLERLNQSDTSWRLPVERRLVELLAGMFLEVRVLLSRDYLGALAYLAQKGTSSAFSEKVEAGSEVMTGLIQKSVDVGETGFTEFLVAIGWKQRFDPGKSEIYRRTYLPKEFTADLSKKEMPAIYRRLFRFEAVDDPRFLIGRAEELAAIAEARTNWEAGRQVAVLITGPRGSGKTSLINCAIKRHLAGVEVIRGDFSERITSIPHLHAHLARLFGLDSADDLEQFLLEHRRIVILEEIERLFLRQIGHYLAVREIQRLIAATCSTTFWILATNQVAFHFLDPAVQFGNTFSHRINVGNVSRDMLQQAILLRHNLSGLRLEFAERPREETWVARLREKLAGTIDAETQFFDALFEESTGVFRTAFEIWLGHLDRVEAGSLYMKLLDIPNLEPVMEVLTPEDWFALKAILQHGSLIPDEHAVIFLEPVSASRARFDQLLAREIIEPDPLKPGFRVRPEALRLVAEGLYKRNLL